MKSSCGCLGPYQMPQPRVLGANNSSAVIAYLMQHIPQASYILYLDKLLTYIRDKGIGITGTCTTKSNILKKFYKMKKKKY
jgi:hypothetical protein